MSAKLLAKAGYVLGLTLWVIVSFVIGQTLAALLVANVPSGANESVLTTVLAALGYVFALCLAIGVPALIRRRMVSRSRRAG